MKPYICETCILIITTLTLQVMTVCKIPTGITAEPDYQRLIPPPPKKRLNSKKLVRNDPHVKDQIRSLQFFPPISTQRNGRHCPGTDRYSLGSLTETDCHRNIGICETIYMGNLYNLPRDLPSIVITISSVAWKV